jgi:hypothetical protein
LISSVRQESDDLPRLRHLWSPSKFEEACDLSEEVFELDFELAEAELPLCKFRPPPQDPTRLQLLRYRPMSSKIDRNGEANLVPHTVAITVEAFLKLGRVPPIFHAYCARLFVDCDSRKKGATEDEDATEHMVVMDRYRQSASPTVPSCLLSMTTVLMFYLRNVSLQGI